MANSAATRKNMVDCQIHPMGVVSEDLLDAFSTIPRELFVSEDRKGSAYTDDCIGLDRDRSLMEPAVHARLLEEVSPKADDVVLDLGCASGYSSAILSDLVSTVIAVEPDQEFQKQAIKNWEDLLICNVACFSHALRDGCPENGPYDLIFLNGAVGHVPEGLLDQLSDNGRLIAVVRGAGEAMGQATLFERSGHNGFSKRILFDANIQYLPGFEPRKEFSF